MKPLLDEDILWVGARVHWIAGCRKKEGRIIDIYHSGAVSGMSIRRNQEEDRVVVIQLNDGKVVMKMESQVKTD